MATSSSAAAAVDDMLKDSKAKDEGNMEGCNGRDEDAVAGIEEEEEDDDDDDDFVNGRKRKSRGRKKKGPAKKSKKAAAPQPKRQKYNDPEVSHLIEFDIGLGSWGLRERSIFSFSQG